MKINHIIQMGRLAAIALAVLAGNAAIAGDTRATQQTVARVIQLPSSNGANQTVTVWVPASSPRTTTDVPATRNSTAKVVKVSALNGGVRDVMVWVPSPEAKFEVAPLK